VSLTPINVTQRLNAFLATQATHPKWSLMLVRGSQQMNWRLAGWSLRLYRRVYIVTLSSME